MRPIRQRAAQAIDVAERERGVVGAIRQARPERSELDDREADQVRASTIHRVTNPCGLFGNQVQAAISLLDEPLARPRLDASPRYPCVRILDSLGVSGETEAQALITFARQGDGVPSIIDAELRGHALGRHPSRRRPA